MTGIVEHGKLYVMTFGNRQCAARLRQLSLRIFVCEIEPRHMEQQELYFSALSKDNGFGDRFMEWLTLD